MIEELEEKEYITTLNLFVSYPPEEMIKEMIYTIKTFSIQRRHTKVVEYSIKELLKTKELTYDEQLVAFHILKKELDFSLDYVRLAEMLHNKDFVFVLIREKSRMECLLNELENLITIINITKRNVSSTVNRFLVLSCLVSFTAMVIGFSFN